MIRSMRGPYEPTMICTGWAGNGPERAPRRLWYSPRPPDDVTFDYGPASAPVLAHARTLARVCERHGTVLPHAAMGFPLRHPAVACVVAGPRTPQQAHSAAGWAAADRADAVWTDLEAVAPPG